MVGLRGRKLYGTQRVPGLNGTSSYEPARYRRPDKGTASHRTARPRESRRSILIQPATGQPGRGDPQVPALVLCEPRDEPVILSDSCSETHQHWSPADATKEYGSSWIFEPHLTWANALW